MSGDTSGCQDGGGVPGTSGLGTVDSVMCTAPTTTYPLTKMSAVPLRGHPKTVNKCLINPHQNRN